MTKPVSVLKLAGLGKLKKQAIDGLAAAAETPIAELPDFPGQGVYAFYYRGKADLYNLPAETFYSIPIYIGKAVAKGSRKGKTANASLKTRLNNHLASIQGGGLNIDDFVCKPLVIEDADDEDEDDVTGIVHAVEVWLIQHHIPLWNSVLDGFGNRALGASRQSQKKSAWDVMNPGRPGTENLLTPDGTAERLLELVKEYYSERATPTNVRAVTQLELF